MTGVVKIGLLSSLDEGKLLFHVRTGKSVALLNYFENHLFSPAYRRVEVPDSMLDALYIVTVWKTKGVQSLGSPAVLVLAQWFN